MKKSNNFTVILLSILLITSIGYIIYDKLYVESKLKNTTSNNNSLSNTTENVKEENSTANTIDTNNNSNSIYNINELKYQESELSKAFGGVDLSNNYIRRITEIDSTNNYQVDLKLSGEVFITTWNTENTSSKNKLSISNVIDIIEMPIAGSADVQRIYMLTTEGNVYVYTLGDSIEKKFSPTKVDKISKVKKLFINSYSKPNAGGSWEIVAINENNECISLEYDSV